MTVAVVIVTAARAATAVRAGKTRCPALFYREERRREFLFYGAPGF